MLLTRRSRLRKREVREGLQPHARTLVCAHVCGHHVLMAQKMNTYLPPLEKHFPSWCRPSLWVLHQLLYGTVASAPHGPCNRASRHPQAGSAGPASAAELEVTNTSSWAAPGWQPQLRPGPPRKEKPGAASRSAHAARGIGLGTAQGGESPAPGTRPDLCRLPSPRGTLPGERETRHLRGVGDMGCAWRQGSRRMSSAQHVEPRGGGWGLGTSQSWQHQHRPSLGPSGG